MNQKSTGILALVLDIILLGLFVLFSPDIIIGLVIAFIVFILILITPLGYIYFLLLLPYESLLMGSAESMYAMRLIVLHLILLISWAKYLLIYGKIELPPRKIFIPLAAYLIWAAVSIPISVSPGASFIAYIKLLGFFAIFLLLYNLVQHRKDIVRLLYIMVIASVPVSLIAIYQYVYLNEFRSWGTFGAANVLGFFAVQVIVACIMLYHLKKDSILARAVSVLALIPTVFALLFSNSRASALALFIFVIFYLVLSKKYKQLILLASGITLIFIMIITNQELLDYLNKAFRLYMGTTGRDLLWRGGIAMIADYFPFGTGYGCVGEVYTYYMRATHPVIGLYLKVAIESGYIHNGYLQVLAELGIVGFFLFLMANFQFTVYLWKASKKSIIKNHSEVIIIALSLILSRLVYSMVESAHPLGPFSNETISMLIYIFAIKLNLLNKKTEDSQISPVINR